MTSLPFRYARRKLADFGFMPRTRLARLALLMVGIELAIYVIQQIFLVAGWRGAGGALDPWILILTLTNCILFTLLGLRWGRRVLLWRLRNRLIVTYVFIGVIPVLLIAVIASLTALLLAGQFAAFVAQSDLDTQIKSLQAMNSTLAASVAPHIGQTKKGDIPETIPLRLYEQFPEAEFRVWYRGQPVYSSSPRPIVMSLPQWARQDFAGVAIDQDKLYLRAVSITANPNGDVITASSIPLDENTLGKISAGIGNFTLYKSAIKRAGNKIVFTNPAAGKEEGGNSDTPVSGGSIPSARSKFDVTVGWWTVMPAEIWANGEHQSLPIHITARLSALYDHLFSTSSELALAEIIRTALVVLALLFGVIELIALLIGLGLTRTITRSVAALYRGTGHVNRGDLRHRIAVRSQDQLAALETSFNSMTESLERLIEEQKEKQRLESELAIAQEVQATLFPQHDIQVTSLELHGVCKPARTVSGDYYDFLPLSHGRLAVAVGDISGKGISAALLMATIHSAVRVYEFGGMPDQTVLAAASAAAISASHGPGKIAPADLVSTNGIHSPRQVLWLLNRHLFHSTPAEKYATLFLGVYDGRGRQLTYTNAGHLPPLIVNSAGEIRKLDTGGTVIGLFEQVEYEECAVRLEPGDLFVAYSDGVTEPENEYGEFGEARLVELLRENRRLPLPRLSQAVIGEVQSWMGTAEQPDDLTLVLARAT